MFRNHQEGGIGANNQDSAIPVDVVSRRRRSCADERTTYVSASAPRAVGFRGTVVASAAAKGVRWNRS
jgi:hypothetical protein